MKLRLLFIALCLTPALSFAQSATHCTGSPLKPEHFQEGRDQVARQPTEAERLTMAKRFVGSQCLTCDQVVLICRDFSKESSKLEFAEFAIGHTFDPENFKKISTVFRSQTSKRDFESLAQSRR